MQFIGYLIFLICFTNYLLGTFYLGVLLQDISFEFDIISEQYQMLSQLYEQIQNNEFVRNKIKVVNVWSLESQYEILCIRFHYGFNYETAKSLYQYHEYHNVKIGSVTNLIEDTSWFEYLFEKNIYKDSTTEVNLSFFLIKSASLLVIVSVIIFSYGSAIAK